MAGFTVIAEDPRIGGVDITTWRAVPHPESNPAGDRMGAWAIAAGVYEDADVWIEIIAEFPKDVAEFIVTAVRNEHARQASVEAINDEIRGLEHEDWRSDDRSRRAMLQGLKIAKGLLGQAADASA